MDDVHDVPIGPVTAALTTRSDGVLHVRANEPPLAFDTRITNRLHEWAAKAPDRTFLAERDSTGAWRRLSFAEAEAHSRRIAAALLARGLSPERPLAILSGNDIEHGLLALGAMRAGIPFAPISPAYSLISSDFAKLRAILALLTPGMVFVAKTAPFARAIMAAVPPDIEIVATSGTLSERPITPFAALAVDDDRAVARAEAETGPETIAKILFTSGSTGQPKGVINTQAMLCANQAMLRYWLPFVQDEPPVLVDWLPWHHTFGGNHNFGFALANGGTLYIDSGKPVPGGFAATARNLTEIAPTIYFNVPKGFEELVNSMREDDVLRKHFFSRLNINFYAGASLPLHVAEGLDALALKTIGKRILMMTGLGATETAPAALVCSKETARPGRVGLPLPGLELKLVPNAGKLEARIKGPTVTPGYWRNPEQTAAAFDEEGFYRFGDALKFADPDDIRQGFVFDGRVSEDFKLATGTWVSVGPMRARLITAFAPLVKDVVITGHDRDDVMALAFPDLDACRAAIGPDAIGLDDAALLAHPSLRADFARQLSALLAEATGSSNRVQRLILLDEPPSIDANEITDKGSINQRAVLTRRAALVEALYAQNAPPEAILPIRRDPSL